MQKSLSYAARIGFGLALIWGVGCGGSSHPASDAKDAPKESTTGNAGAGGGAAGNDGGAAGATGGSAAGKDGGAGATGGGTAGAGGGAAGNDAGAADKDGGTAGAGGGTAGAGGGAAGNDGGAAGNDGGAAGNDGGAAGNDSGTDASDAGDTAADQACPTICTLGAKRCGAGGGVQTCGLDANSCLNWGAEAACGAHQACTGAGTCSCNATTCTVAGAFCSSGTATSTCTVDAQGCLFVSAGPVACATRMHCAGAAGAAACACDVDPTCTQNGATFCPTATSKSTCAVDGNGCFFVGATANCPTHQSCGGGYPTGACACVAAPTECMAATGPTCATSTSIVTCDRDAANCLFVSVPAVSCAAHEHCAGGPGLGACACDTGPAVCTGAGNFCDGNASQACGQTPAGSPGSCIFSTGVTACTANATCSGATGLCVCNTAPAGCSTTPGPFCDSPTSIATCAQDSASCSFLSVASAGCGAHRSCSGAAGAAACVCNTVPPGCTGNGTFCDSSSQSSTCALDQGCNIVTAGPANCPANQTCKGAGLGGACSCDHTCTAAQLGTYCLDTLHQATCTDDANSCHLTGPATACVGTQTCQGADGVGSCQCQPAGATSGTGCSTLGATTCQNNTVLTCTQDPLSPCKIWAPSQDCPSTGLVCGTKAGLGIAAACQCADHAGNDYFVDPVAGTDAQAGVFPTGNNSPSNCRFGTLGKGLSLATSGNHVVATTATGSATFSAETFPLSVGAGVTLTTSDLTLTPANYTIDFNGAGAAVSLASSSTFEAFTVANAGGNPAASAVSIPGTGVTLARLILEGGGTLATGINVNGGGNASISDVTVTGFVTGMGVSTSSGPAVSLSTSQLTSNTTGLSLSNGTVTATTVTVSGGGTGVAITGAGATLIFNSGEVHHNSGGGITMSAGTGTLGTVNVHENTGSGVTLSGGTLGIGASTIQLNTTTGISQSAGALTIGAATLKGNGTDGLNTLAGTATVNTGARFDSNTGNGITASTTLNINGAAATPIVVTGNGGDGVSVSAGTLTSNYLTLTSNGTGAVKNSGLRVSGVAVVNLGTASDAAVLIQGNGLSGVNINATTSGSAIDMRHSTVSGNGGNGISVDLNGGTVAPGAVASITTSTISGNTVNGVQVARAPLVGGVAKLTLDTLTVTGNGVTGIYLQGNSGAVGAVIKGSKISGNISTGLRVEQVGGATQETIQNNDITLNGAGGIQFNTGSTLSSFTGNLVHSNVGDQILVNARQTGNVAWNFRTPGNACDANRNQVYCYQNGGVGIRISATPAGNSTQVDARNVSWMNAAPSAGTDYVVLNPPAANSLDATLPCAAVACP
jgi:Right handed beta helix region